MEDHSLTLQDELYKLLFDSHYRERFLAGAWDELGIHGAQREALSAVDHGELRRVAATIVRNMRGGRPGPAHAGLQHWFPLTFARLGEGVEVDDLIERFLASEEHAEHGVLPIATAAPSCEECFYHFLRRDPAFVARDPCNVAVLRHEFLHALCRLLAINDVPSFEVREPLLRRAPRGVWIVEHYPAPLARELLAEDAAADSFIPILYAAASKQFITGRVTPLAVALLEAGPGWPDRQQASELAREHEVSVASVVEAARSLAQLGLLEEA